MSEKQVLHGRSPLATKKVTILLVHLFLFCRFFYSPCLYKMNDTSY